MVATTDRWISGPSKVKRSTSRNRSRAGSARTGSNRWACSTRIASLAQSRPSGCRRRGATTRRPVRTAVSRSSFRQSWSGATSSSMSHSQSKSRARPRHAFGEPARAAPIVGEHEGGDARVVEIQQPVRPVGAGVVHDDDGVRRPDLIQEAVQAAAQELAAIVGDDDRADTGVGRIGRRAVAASRGGLPHAPLPIVDGTARRAVVHGPTGQATAASWPMIATHASASSLPLVTMCCLKNSAWTACSWK